MSRSALLQTLYNISAQSDPVPETAAAVIEAVWFFLDNIELSDQAQQRELEELNMWFKKSHCSLYGHNWIHDHCGYWGHQYCSRCGVSRYPDLSSKSHADAIEETEGCSEEEWRAGF